MDAAGFFTPFSDLNPLHAGKIKKYSKIKLYKAKSNCIKDGNPIEPIISTNDFEVVQNLLQVDSRISMERGETSLFSGLLFCGDCGEQMVRRISRYKDTSKVYYICSTKNRGEGCSRHSIEENILAELVEISVCKYMNLFLQQEKVFQKTEVQEENMEFVIKCQKEMARLKQEQNKYYRLCDGLYEDLGRGVVTKEEFDRLRAEFQRKAEQLQRAQKGQEKFLQKMFQSGVAPVSKLMEFRNTLEFGKIDRYTLTSLVKRIYVYENKKIKIDFYFQDEFQMMQRLKGVGEKAGIAVRREA